MDLLAALAIVYAVAASADAEVGDAYEAGASVPAGVRGLLLPGYGVAQLEDGTAATVGLQGGRLSIQAGRLRVAAERDVTVDAAGLEIRVVGGRAIVAVEPGAVTLCALDGNVTLQTPGPAVASTALPASSCVVVRGFRPASTIPMEEGFGDALRQGAEASSPVSPEIPDVLGDPAEAIAEVEAEAAEEMERGSRQEAAACGCSEDSGGGGSLDGGGGSRPTPEPEPLAPGVVRVQVRLPARIISPR